MYLLLIVQYLHSFSISVVLFFSTAISDSNISAVPEGASFTDAEVEPHFLGL